MARSSVYLVGIATTAMTFLVAARPDAYPAERELLLAGLPVPSNIQPLLEGCPADEAREAGEEADCLQAVRIALQAGEMDLAEAVERLRNCVFVRAELSDAEAIANRADLEEIFARLAFGETPSRDDLARLAASGVIPSEVTAPVRASARRLAAAGVGPDGFAEGSGPAILTRIQTDESFRADFRAVFGAVRADNLDVLLSDGVSGSLTAVTIGATTIIPNRPAVYATPDGMLAVDASVDAEATGAATVSTMAYRERLFADLLAVEEARQQYMESSARFHEYSGSIGAFVGAVRPFRGEADERAELRVTAMRNRAILAARLANLRRRMGADPFLYRMAEESVGIASSINTACGNAAEHRRGWIRAGAGVMTGLAGAAGAVIVTGATGTVPGGVIIALALEAGAGAYLVARAEQAGFLFPSDQQPAVEAPAPSDPETLSPSEASKPGDRAEIVDDDAQEDHAVSDGSADVSTGNRAELRESARGAGRSDPGPVIDDYGAPRELGLVLGEEGAGEEELDGEAGGVAETDSREPRRNTIPPVLPEAIPEAMRELPPLLDTPMIRSLRELSLPEIQRRLDDFLAAGSLASRGSRAEPEVEAVAARSAEQMLNEARAALSLWETHAVLSAGFGEFFIHAETEKLNADRRPPVLARSMSRYLEDRGLYVDSRDLAELRQRLGARLVVQCRAGAEPGDLGLVACSDETALSMLVVAALRDAGISPPAGSTLGIQAFGSRFEAVLYSREQNTVFSLTRGGEMEGVVAPIYHPAAFYYTYLLEHGVTPAVDLDQQLLIALPDRAMPEAMAAVEACAAKKGPGVLRRAVNWLTSMVGIRLINKDDCNEEEAERALSARHAGGDGRIDFSIPSPISNPLKGGQGSGGGGSQGGGGGGGGGNPLSGNEPSDPAASGGSGGGKGAGGGDEGGKGGTGTGADGAGAKGESRGGSGGGDGGGSVSGSGGGATAENAGDGNGQGGSTPGGRPAEGGATSEGGYVVRGSGVPDGPNLTRVGRETVRAAERYETAPALGIMPWRLRDDEGMLTGSRTSVLWADNPRALERFGDDDLFITLAPAEVEAQRRMLDADAFPIFPENASCESVVLPPRRVFRRLTTEDPGYRYMFCDQDESMVIFRAREDAESYSRLSAPDRPLLLARLASERIARFEQSEDINRLRLFFEDPDVVRGWSREDIRATARVATELVIFQDALESALVQSMNELGPSESRAYYYEMHRQVLQAPFFIGIAEAAFRLNQRLSSDPLQSLAWTNALEALPRQGFFDLYYTIGSYMEWPERWETLLHRYGNEQAASPAASDGEPASLDFLQILSDPSRVRVDWNAERGGDPSIRDRMARDGAARGDRESTPVTTALDRDRQDEEKHLREGTGGQGTGGTGTDEGPEDGRPLPLMVRIRLRPDGGTLERSRESSAENQLLPGGARGGVRRSSEESASRQEPVLWVSPRTFVEAVLSNWDSRELRPETAGRVPPILRLNERLRQVYLREFRSSGVYDNRLRAAMEIFSRAGWLRYTEAREAMGGSLASVKAVDQGRFSGAYSGNAPINDQDRIRIPNFFQKEGVVIPGDLFDPVREYYSSAVLGIFDLQSLASIPSASRLSTLESPSGGTAGERSKLLKSLEMIRQQAREAE
ncbi:MAG: hypothetical protein LBG44_03745 [Gemmatimonadota bacterium]|jgi:hypothetical protein|nr:hypothetical protein [Gemmatimonadota bacterium]